jgi:hypothetical protein
MLHKELSLLWKADRFVEEMPIYLLQNKLFITKNYLNILSHSLCTPVVPSRLPECPVMALYSLCG